MKAGFIQTNPIFANPKENLGKVLAKLKGIDSDLAVLPELFNTGYNFKTKDDLIKYAETKDGETAKALQRIAKEKNMCIVAGIAEKEGNGIYNSAFMITPDKVNVYRKAHLFKNEKDVFKKGNTGFNVFEFKGAKIGLMVCFDWIFPEAARTLALKGCDIIAHPANLILPYCPDAMVTRSIENRVFTITCNRIGKENNIKFIGLSQITSPKGKIICRASHNKEEIKIVDIDFKEARNKNITDNNHVLNDRRTDMYQLGV